MMLYDACNSRFTQKTILNSHIASFHGGIKPVQNVEFVTMHFHKRVAENNHSAISVTTALI